MRMEYVINAKAKQIVHAIFGPRPKLAAVIRAGGRRARTVLASVTVSSNIGLMHDEIERAS